MDEDERAYGVIVEWKTEAPIMFESRLLAYDDAAAKMKEFERDSRVIRVAVYKAVYQSGNESLLPKEPKNG